jgi:hypothetical protein
VVALVRVVAAIATAIMLAARRATM